MLVSVVIYILCGRMVASFLKYAPKLEVGVRPPAARAPVANRIEAWSAFRCETAEPQGGGADRPEEAGVPYIV